jgi:hypothetical protein
MYHEDIHTYITLVGSNRKNNYLHQLDVNHEARSSVRMMI